jgi:hypothetical protein
MILNEAFMGLLTPEEKLRYEDLFVMRQKSHDALKPFRKDYNTLKAKIKKLEKVYGASSEYIRNPKEVLPENVFKNNVLGSILRAEGKYRDIEYSLRLGKDKQKQFTKMLHKFPYDLIKNKGCASNRISIMEVCIGSARDKILGAKDDVRIANKYLDIIYWQLKYRADKEAFEKRIALKNAEKIK